MRLSIAHICLPCLTLGMTINLQAQDSAPSSHMVFDDNFDGDIIINEVRVPKPGVATYTYYEAIGWRGTGAGYAGIQAHPKANLYIFSIWDNKSHTAPIRTVHRGPGTETVGFGGEGTGLKSWNFKLGWSPDVWYTLLARTWPVGKHTYYGFWSRAGDTKKWTHLVTMDVATENATFKGSTDAFIEDWLNTGKNPRATNLRNGWKRKLSGEWHPFGTGRYSVNSWDLVKGKRSFNFRTNWDGGARKDASGEYYYMVAGGKETVPTAKNPSRHSIRRVTTKPGFDVVEITNLQVARSGDTASVTWTLDEKSTPQFSYEIQLFESRTGEGKPLLANAVQVPHVRKATLDLSKIRSTGDQFLHLRITDVLDQKSRTKIVRMPAQN